jgi:hypothetical protein
MPGYYVAASRFDRTSPGWEDFYEWRGLPQLVEVVSMENAAGALDADQLTDDEWRHVAPVEEVRCPAILCFRQLDALRGCISDLRRDEPTSLLWVFREPVEQPPLPETPSTFTFLGYDLIDDYTCISALTNCGGFPAAFSDADISELGLIRTLERAKQIQIDLRREYPEEPHADCSLWAIFRSIETP